MDLSATDAELVAAALAGDTHAFTFLYRRHAPVVGRRLRYIVGNSEDARDLLQMTFVEVHRCLARYQPDRPFGAWLHGIAFHVTGRYLKARRRKWWLSFGEATPERSRPSDLASSTETRVSQRQEVAEVFAVLNEMGADKRIAFVLREFEQLDLSEVASLTQVTRQTAWARIESARRELRSKLRLDGAAAEGSRQNKGST